MLLKAAEYEKNWKIERDIERREREETTRIARDIQRQKEREQQRVKELFDNACTWNKCKLTREYNAAVKNNSDGGEVGSWVEWANKAVDRVELRIMHPET